MPSFQAHCLHKEAARTKASEPQNRASSVGAGFSFLFFFLFFFFTQQVGSAPETTGRRPVLLAHLTLITGVDETEEEKQPSAPGVGLWDNSVSVCVCVCV